MKKDVRRLKTYKQSGCHYKLTPAITLKGKWLEELGFEAGAPLTVQCEERRLVIVPG